MDSEGTSLGVRSGVVRETTKYFNIERANDACRQRFHDIAYNELDWGEYMVPEWDHSLMRSCDDELKAWDWVDECGCGVCV